MGKDVIAYRYIICREGSCYSSEDGHWYLLSVVLNDVMTEKGMS